MNTRKKQELLSLLKQYKHSTRLLKQGDNDILTVQDGIKGIMFKGLKKLNNSKTLKQYNIKFRIKPYNNGYQYGLTSKDIRSLIFNNFDYSNNDAFTIGNKLVNEIQKHRAITIEPQSFFQDNLDSNDVTSIQYYSREKGTEIFKIKSSKQIRTAIKLIQKKLIADIDKSLKLIEKYSKELESLAL